MVELTPIVDGSDEPITIANYIGTDECSMCGKTDEVLDISDEILGCQECINKAFEAHWS